MALSERIRKGVESAPWVVDEVERLERDLAAETKNKQQFERDWLECCDKLLACRATCKSLKDALFELANLHVVVYSQSPEGRAYMKKLGDLMAQIDDTALNRLLAEGQARERELRDALAKIKAHVTGEAAPNWSGGEATYRSRGYLADICEVAQQPTDDTAIKATLAAERTRCAMEVRRFYKGSSAEIWNDAVGVCEQAIHALGDE